DMFDLGGSATMLDLEIAYRELAKARHPYRFKDYPKLAEKANKEFTEINAAYKRLLKATGLLSGG
ncbi:MAG: J domain-containing protein, partial [Arenicellales bacterium]|nr:J domain-containing protein [Arenicellales bacterium]